ncbi:MAG: GRP family sugar transporter [Puniceicoccaceae bacterium]
MDVVGVVFALMCVMAWGSWLVPSQNVKFSNEQAKAFYVALSTLISMIIVVAIRGEFGDLGSAGAWVPVLGGLIWAVSAYCAFLACNHIGLAKAFGIWAPLNIIVSFIWGLVLFGQFRDADLLLGMLAFGSVSVAIVGILMIIFAGGGDQEAEKDESKKPMLGLAGAVGAGVLWGTYFIPSAWLSRTAEDAVEISAYASALPLAVGMLIGSTILVILSGKSPKLEDTGSYVRALSSGVLWALGNTTMLLMVKAIGPGPGYTIASLCVVVNALWGVFYFKDPHPKSKAAKLTIIGIIIATFAGVILGNLESVHAMF